MIPQILHVEDHFSGGNSKSWARHLYENREKFIGIKNKIFVLRQSDCDPPNDDCLFVYSSKSRYNLLSFFSLKKYIKCSKVDVVIPHTMKAVLFCLILRVFFFKKIKLVISEHGAINKSDFKWYKWLIRLFQNYVDLFIAVSESTKTKLMLYARINPDKIKILYNFVNREMFNPKNFDYKEEKKMLGLEDKYVIGFVGRLNKMKNLDILINCLPEIINSIPNAHLLVVGGGPERSYLENLVSSLKLQNNVTFFGYCNDMPRTLSSFDVNILVSQDENLSKTLLESASMYIYSIVTDVGGNSEIINDNIGRLLKGKLTAKRIIQSIYELRAQRKDEALFEKALIPFTLQKHVVNSEEIYQKLFIKRTSVTFISLSSYAFFVPESKVDHGGAELQMFLWARELAKDKNFYINFLVGDYGQDKTERKNNINLYRSVNPMNGHRFFNAVKVFYLLIKLKSDIYITTTVNNINYVVSLYCKLFNKKHIHRTAIKYDVDDSYRQWFFVKKFLYRKMIKLTDQVITQSQDHYDLLLQNYHRVSKVIKNGIDINEIYNQDKKEYILWVGRNVQFKRPDLVIKLARVMPDEHFVVICKETQEEFIKDLRRKFSQLANVSFFDRVPFNESQVIFNEAKIFINSSLYEGFPNTFLQAGLAATPIVSLYVNPDNFLELYSCGFYCNGNLELMCDKIRLLMHDDDLYKQLSNNIYLYVKEHHDISKQANLLKSILIG